MNGFYYVIQLRNPGLWEMRMHGKDGIARAVYTAIHGRSLLVLHVFVKKSQTTPRAAIATAYKRLEPET